MAHILVTSDRVLSEKRLGLPSDLYYIPWSIKRFVCLIEQKERDYTLKANALFLASSIRDNTLVESF